jgi:DNA-binding IclR family transcriptional regulator
MSSSAKRALQILETVARGSRPLGVTEIARGMGVPAGTAFRSLDALERSSYVQRYQASSRYVLGDAASGLCQSIFARFRIRDACTPYLRQLAFASGHTTWLTVPVGWYGIRIASAPGTSEIIDSRPVGGIGLLSADYTGKAILAFSSTDSIAQMTAWARRHGLKMPKPAKLQQELCGIAERGYSLQESRFVPGQAAVAFAIRRDQGAVASIAIEGPAFDLAARGPSAEFARWREIVGTVEKLISSHSALCEEPFGHLPRDGILLDGGD